MASNWPILKTPEHNYFEPLPDASNEAWRQTLERLAASQHQWVTYLSQMDEGDFQQQYPPNQLTYYEHIQGILQHDAYHLGQIVLLAKMV